MDEIEQVLNKMEVNYKNSYSKAKENQTEGNLWKIAHDMLEDAYTKYKKIMNHPPSSVVDKPPTMLFKYGITKSSFEEDMKNV